MKTDVLPELKEYKKPELTILDVSSTRVTTKEIVGFEDAFVGDFSLS